MNKSNKQDARLERRKERRDAKRHPDNIYPLDPVNHVKKEIKPLRPLTQAQHTYLQAIQNNTITFAVGPAGTGKTYVAGSWAAEQLKNGDVERIIITRPAVEAGEKFGFLPGELTEKYQPFIEPFTDVLNERLGKSFVEYCTSHGKIIASPLSFMRGKTFKDCVIILDEAQNTTAVQMKLFLTRIGENCKVIVDGDLEQSDINGISGLLDAVRRLQYVPSVRVVQFGVEDIVRSGIVRDIIRAYA